VLFVGGVQRQNVGLLKAQAWHFLNPQEMRKILLFEVETVLTIVGCELFLFILHKLLA
jgi:hypothetical protein